MKKIKTTIEGCFELIPNIFEDERGRLVKTFQETSFSSVNLDTNFTEEYYSLSKKNVLRGLHFQTPPHDHVKCVTCLYGAIFDAVLDLRKGSSTYLKHFCIELSAIKGNMLYVPKGLAHGFFTLSDEAIFLNKTTTVYNSDYESGIRWDSCGIDWPTAKPILSEKDKNLTELENYKSSFLI